MTNSNSETGGLDQWVGKNPRLAAVLKAAVIILLTLLAYVPAMRSGFIWDDDHHVTQNRLLQSWTGLQRIWLDIFSGPSEYPLPQYYPMTHTSFWLEYRLWGLNPAGYHAVNVVLHICNALLLWLILWKLKIPGSWLAAAIFALHPLNAESVAWIAERKNVLSLLFFLCSLYVYLRYAGVISGSPAPMPAGSDEQIQWFRLPDDRQRLYALSAALFLCALFSKTVASFMPVIALMIVWWKRGRISLRDLWPVLPMLVIGAAMGALTAYMEQVRVGVAMRAKEWDYSPTLLGEFGARCIIAGKAIWFYVYKLLVPFSLMFNYPRWKIDPADPVQYIPAISVVVVVVVIALGRSLWGGGVLLAAMCYLVMLFPAMGFIDVWPMQYSFVANHFAYYSIAALTAALAATARRWLPTDVLAGSSAVILLLLLGINSVQQRIYHDSATLWIETWKQSGKTSWLAANNYGVLLLKRGDQEVLDAAEEWFKTVITLKPDYPDARVNLAAVAIRRGQPEKAIEYYNEAISIQPNYVDAHYFLAELLISLERFDQAEKHLHQAIALYPRHELAYLGLGRIALKRGDVERAVEFFERAVDANPQSPRAYADYGEALLSAGRIAQGLLAWEQAMSLDPDDPNLPNEFGAKLANSGDYPRAVEFLHRALRIDSRNVQAITNLGVVAARTGFPEQARKLFMQALEIDPKFVKARENLKALEEGRLGPATRPATANTSQPPAQP